MSGINHIFPGDAKLSDLGTNWSDELRPAGGRQEREEQAYHSRPPASGARWSKGLWAALALTWALLLAAGYYGYSGLREGNIRLSEVPGILRSITVFSGRLDRVEPGVEEGLAQWASLAERMGKLEHQVSGGLRRAQKRSEELTAQLEQRVNERMDAREGKLAARLRDLETAEQAQAALMARLQEEVGAVRRELASARQESAAQFASAKEELGRSDQQLGALNQRLEVERVDFEVGGKRLTRLAPEISFQITKADVKRQRYSGRIWYEPDGRVLRFSRQGVQQPVIFYSRQDARRYEVVVTALTRRSAAGYVLLPAPPASVAEAPGAGEPTVSSASPPSF